MNKDKEACNYHCEVEAAFAMIGGKWKTRIIWHIGSEKVRFNELRDILENVSPRMLSKQLRELEQDHLVIRTQYAEVPVRVEYELTDRAKALLPIIDEICDWVIECYPEVAEQIQ
jgi:DNA-binding HxlR family transcriptional regulator